MASLRKGFDRYLDRRTDGIPAVALMPDERLALVRQHGNFSLAYSTAVQDGLSYFGDADGYIAFDRKMGSAFALSDPVAAPAHRQTLIARFVAEGADPCFVQVGVETAQTLAALGYKINRMGIDSRLTLTPETFTGKRNETVRYSERWLFKNGYSIEEDLGGLSSSRVEALSDLWRAERIVKRREMRFLNRPFSAGLGEGMRRFVLIDPHGHAVALLDFDPLHQGGETIGYTTFFKRKLPGVTPHAEIGMTKFAVDRFRDEGKSIVTLGLSPLAVIDASGFGESASLRAILRRLYGSRLVNDRIFNLMGQAAFKRRFHGAEEPTYIAFRKTSPMQLIALLRLCKAI